MSMSAQMEKAGKATLVDGRIHAFIYDQEGGMQPFVVADTPGNRHFIDWLQRHDRYTPATGYST